MLETVSETEVKEHQRYTPGVKASQAVTQVSEESCLTARPGWSEQPQAPEWAWVGPRERCLQRAGLKQAPVLSFILCSADFYQIIFKYNQEQTKITFFKGKEAP